MKKLITMATVALVAVVVNAASCNWDPGVWGFEGMDNQAFDDYTYNYQILALGNTAVTADKITYDGTSATVNGAAATSIHGGTGISGWGPDELADLGSKVTAGNYYTLVIWSNDSSKYGVGAIVQASMDTTPGATDFNPLAFANTTVFPYDEATPGIMANMGGAVPEPTSGLLLLLGVAGMALRRRRA